MDKMIQRAKKGLSQQERIEFLHYIDRIAGPVKSKNYQKDHHRIFVEKELMRLEVQKRFSYAAAYAFSSVTAAIISYLYLSLPSYTVITGLVSLSLSLYLQFYPLRQDYSDMGKLLGQDELEKNQRKQTIENFWVGAGIIFMIPLILPTALVTQAMSFIVNTLSIAFYGLRKHIENKIEQQIVLPEKAAQGILQKGYPLFEDFAARNTKEVGDLLSSYTTEDRLSIDITSLQAFALLNTDGTDYLHLLQRLIEKNIDSLSLDQQIDYFIIRLKQSPDDLYLHHELKQLLTLKDFFPNRYTSDSATILFNQMFQAIVHLTHNPTALLSKYPKEGWDLMLKTYTSPSIYTDSKNSPRKNSPRSDQTHMIELTATSSSSKRKRMH